MFTSGYLTCKQVIFSSDDASQVELEIPNKSVRKELKNAIEWCFTDKNPKYVESLNELLIVLKEPDPFYLESYLN